MKYLLILFSLLGLILYLNRSYAYFFDYIGHHYQVPPQTNQILVKGKGPKTLTYVALGDSLTAGVGATTTSSLYPYLIAQRIAQEKGESVKMLNLGVPGATSADLISKELSQASAYKPDIITVLIGINDLHNLVSLHQFQDNYTTIVHTLQSTTHAQIILINIPYLGSGSILFPPYSFALDVRTMQYNRVIQTLAQQNKLRYIDLYAGTKNQFNQDNHLYSIDSFHPSDQGYQLFGKIINASSSL